MRDQIAEQESPGVRPVAVESEKEGEFVHLPADQFQSSDPI